MRIIITLAVMSTLCFGQSKKLSIPKELEGKILNFSVYAINEDKLNQDDFKAFAKKSGAKRIVLSFFATWCTNCMEEFALLKKNASELQKNKVLVNLIDVGQTISKSGDKVRDMVSQYAGNSFSLYFDPRGNLLKDFGLVKGKNLEGALPLTIVLDSDLRVLGILSAVSEEDYPQILWSEL